MNVKFEHHVAHWRKHVIMGQKQQQQQQKTVNNIKLLLLARGRLVLGFYGILCLYNLLNLIPVGSLGEDWRFWSGH